MNPIHNYLVITAVGSYHPDIIAELTRACTQCGCNILSSKFDLFGKEITVALFVAGNWGTIAKMEATLPSLEQKLGLNISIRRTNESVSTNNSMPYNIQVSAIDKLGIMSGLTDFLSRLDIPIEEITANTYLASNGTRMANLNFKINVPEKIHLATLREQFISYCDDNNLDAFLEPSRA